MLRYASSSSTAISQTFPDMSLLLRKVLVQICFELARDGSLPRQDLRTLARRGKTRSGLPVTAMVCETYLQWGRRHRSFLQSMAFMRRHGQQGENTQ